jgi:hypothetical protein
MGYYDVKTEFARYFIPNINAKIATDLHKFDSKPEIFWKWINESICTEFVFVLLCRYLFHWCLAFTRALQRSIGFKSEYYSVFQHFFDKIQFQKWLQIEVDCTHLSIANTKLN